MPENTNRTLTLPLQVFVGDTMVGTAELVFHIAPGKGDPAIHGSFLPALTIWEHAERDGDILRFPEAQPIELRDTSGRRVRVSEMTIRSEPDEHFSIRVVLSAPSPVEQELRGRSTDTLLGVVVDACGYCGAPVSQSDPERVWVSVSETSGKVYAYTAHRACLEDTFGPTRRRDSLAWTPNISTRHLFARRGSLLQRFDEAVAPASGYDAACAGAMPCSIEHEGNNRYSSTWLL